MSVIVRVATSREATQALSAAVVQVYREAFRQPPYDRGEAEVAEFAFSFAQHTLREGFLLAYAQDDNSRRVLGLAYGYDPRPGQWWHDQVAGALSPEMAVRWLSGSFQLAELAVVPDSQGQGIGGRLHDMLLADVPHRTVVLSTMARETVAAGLYRRRGWIPLVDVIHFSGVEMPYRILGLDLDARRRTCRPTSAENQG